MENGNLGCLESIHCVCALVLVGRSFLDVHWASTDRAVRVGTSLCCVLIGFHPRESISVSSAIKSPQLVTAEVLVLWAGAVI